MTDDSNLLDSFTMRSDNPLMNNQGSIEQNQNSSLTPSPAPLNVITDQNYFEQASPANYEEEEESPFDQSPFQEAADQDDDSTHRQSTMKSKLGIYNGALT